MSYRAVMAGLSAGRGQQPVPARCRVGDRAGELGRQPQPGVDMVVTSGRRALLTDVHGTSRSGRPMLGR